MKAYGRRNKIYQALGIHTTTLRRISSLFFRLCTRDLLTVIKIEKISFKLIKYNVPISKLPRRW